VKLIDGGGTGIFILARDDNSASALFQLVVHVPTSLATAVTPLLEHDGLANGVDNGENGFEKGSLRDDTDSSGGGAAAMRERADMLRTMLRECMIWGRGLHSSTSQLNLNRFGHTASCPCV
jgi:hypothetical protein